jgi:preprotein translocase subunit YajC
LEAITSIRLLAQEAPAPSGSIFDMLPALVGIVILFYFLMFRPESRKRAAQQSLLEQIKKNDRVLTVGGIYGVVTNVQRDVDRVTIRVDETNNTKLDITFGSIARVVTDTPAGESSDNS